MLVYLSRRATHLEPLKEATCCSLRLVCPYNEPDHSEKPVGDYKKVVSSLCVSAFKSTSEN